MAFAYRSRCSAAAAADSSLGGGVRECACILILVGVTAGWAARVEVPANAPQADSLDWVRTVEGWRRVEQLTSRPIPRPALHPFTVASLQGLASAFVLLSVETRRAATRAAR
ncbi:MAG: hypothetical protein AAGJ46_05900 [Planctomycetota bacterium]